MNGITSKQRLNLFWRKKDRQEILKLSSRTECPMTVHAKYCCVWHWQTRESGSSTIKAASYPAALMLLSEKREGRSSYGWMLTRSTLRTISSSVFKCSTKLLPTTSEGH